MSRDSRDERPASTRSGFVVPAVIVIMAVLSVLAVAAITVASDEERAARAMRESSEAFYTAEAGLHETRSLVSDSALQALAPGDSIVISWREVPHGGGYRGVIHRLDEGGDVQTLYRLTVSGRGPGANGAQRILRESFSYAPYPTLDAAITVRGRAVFEDTSSVSGLDDAPAEWLDAGVCDPTSFADQTGLRIEDTDDLEVTDPGVEFEGSPPMEEDPSIDDDTFNEFGGPSWDDLIDLADHVIGIPSDKLNPEIRPSYNPDGSCNTDDPYNWGSNDPSDPCFDYFPVIYVKDRGMRASLGGSYGQAFVIADAEFDIQSTNEDGDYTSPGEFAGIVLGRGCFETNLAMEAFGGVVWDRVDAPGCNDQEKGLWLSGNPWDPTQPSPAIHYSSCVVERTIQESRVGELFGWHSLTGRPFSEVFR